MRKTLAVVAIVCLSVAGGILGADALSNLVKPEPPSVTINYDAPVPPMNPPTQLHVQNVTKDACDDLGGTYDAKVVLCKNVDY